METIERALADEGPLTRRAAARAARRGRRADRGPGADPPLFLAALRGIARARPDGRQAARLRPGRATGSASRSRSTATRRSPSWPAATWSATPRRTIATSPGGPGCRCATPAPAWRRSPRSWASVRTAWSTSPAPRSGAEVPPPRLLGAFDPVLLGWTSREQILGPHTELVTLNGIFRPFAMVKGRAVAHLEAQQRQGRRSSRWIASRRRRSPLSTLTRPTSSASWRLERLFCALLGAFCAPRANSRLPTVIAWSRSSRQYQLGMLIA